MDRRARAWCGCGCFHGGYRNVSSERSHSRFLQIANSTKNWHLTSTYFFILNCSHPQIWLKILSNLLIDNFMQKYWRVTHKRESFPKVKHRFDRYVNITNVVNSWKPRLAVCRITDNIVNYEAKTILKTQKKTKTKQKKQNPKKKQTRQTKWMESLSIIDGIRDLLNPRHYIHFD